jgi:hypothetical protein
MIGPISSSCRVSSRNSNGGVIAARRTFPEKMARSPNHSKHSVTMKFEELAREDAGRTRLRVAGTAILLWLLTVLDSIPPLRAHCLNAFEKASSAVRYRGIPRRCSRPHIRVSCNCPSGKHLWRRNGQDTSHTQPSWFPHMARQGQQITVADGLFWLSQIAERNSVVRKLQIVKLRGQASVPGLHTFRITDAGLQAFSRISG